jgi:hypothetical protein
MSLRRGAFGKDPPEPLALLLAAPPLVLSGLFGLLTLAVWGLRCDESCSGEDWQHTALAWQWDVVLILGATTFVSVVAFVACIWRSRVGGSLVAFLVATGAFLVELWWLDSDWKEWSEFVSRHGGVSLLVLGGVASGLAAVARVSRDLS